jgi:hypothetical protein
MDSHLTRPGISRDLLGVGPKLLGLAMLFSGAAGAKPPLAIVSPTNGTVVFSGSSLRVTVAIQRDAAPLGVALVGEGPLGTTDVQPVSGTTLAFSLTIPRDTVPGPYRLWAVTTDSRGSTTESPELRVFVESADAPRELAIYPPHLSIHGVGQTIAWAVIGKFADGSRVDVTQSRYLKVTSENPAVASANHGSIEGRRSGRTVLEVRYGRATQRIPIQVFPAARGAGHDATL